MLKSSEIMLNIFLMFSLNEIMLNMFLMFSVSNVKYIVESEFFCLLQEIVLQWLSSHIQMK